VLEQINEDRERVKSRTLHKVAKLSEQQPPTNPDSLAGEVIISDSTSSHERNQKKEKLEEKEVNNGNNTATVKAYCSPCL
jgi:hypothetical protein